MTEQVFTPSCPERVVAHAARQLGPQLWNQSGTTRCSLERMCAFAIGAWVSKYGPLSADQEEYAWEVFEWAITDAMRSSRGQHVRFAHLYQNFHRIVNEERVHEGMKRRRGRVDSVVNTDGLMVAA